MKHYLFTLAAIAALVVSDTNPVYAEPKHRLIFLDNTPGQTTQEQPKPGTCDDEESILVFGNGINNSQITASTSRTTLVEEFEKYLNTSGKRTQFGNYRGALAFNKSLSDVDKHGGFRTFLWDFVRKVTPDATRLNTAQLFKSISNSDQANALFKTELIEYLKNYDKTAAANSPVASRHYKGYNDLLDLGRRVVLLGHSHGTIVANLAFGGLNESLNPGFGIVAAAVMDGEVAGSERFFPQGPVPYVTIEEDGIAWLFRGLWGSDLPSNVDEFPLIPRQDTGGHNFETFYMHRDAELDDHRIVRGSGTARKMLFDHVLANHDEMQEKPCHGLSYTLPDNTRGYLGYSQIGTWHEYAGLTELGDNTPFTNQSGYVDWKGHYVNGEPTRVLSWRGGSNRYHAKATALKSELYRDGRLAYRTPLPVIGAAIQKDAAGNEFVIAVTTTLNQRTNTVFRMDALNASKSAALFDPNTGKGWKVIGSFPVSADSFYSPWFFNGSGTKATTLQRAQKFLPFSRRVEPPGCGGVPSQKPELCKPGPLGFEAAYPAGVYEVSVLNQFEMTVSTGSAASVSIADLGYESGDSGLLATDYKDDELMVLREVNINPARGFRLDTDEPESAGRWLTLNNRDITTPDILDCTRIWVCRPDRNIGYSEEVGGWIRSLNDGEHTMHILSMDLRSESFFYSVLKMDSTEYNLFHNGEKKQLANIPSRSVQAVGVHAMSRYGYEASYANRWDVGIYVDEITGNTVHDPEKRNPVLGQYEHWPIIGYGQDIATVPENFGMSVLPSGALVLSARFSDGSTVNFHSEAPADKLDYRINLDLSGTTVTPLMVQ